MAHARRKFAEVAKLSKNKNGVSHEVIKRIAGLYKIEKELKIKEATEDVIRSARQEKSKPILESLKIYLEEKQAGVLPKSHLGVAIAYTLNHWVGLNRYLNVILPKSMKIFCPFDLSKKKSSLDLKKDNPAR